VGRGLETVAERWERGDSDWGSITVPWL